MSNYTALVGISQAPSPVEPTGLTGLKLSVEQENGRAFYRQKVNGNIEFSDKLFNLIKPLEGVCCRSIPFTIFRSCGGSLSKFLEAQFKTNQIEWTFETCTAKLGELEILDNYRGVYKTWEKKVNLCTAPRGKRVKYVYRKPQTTTQNGQEVTLHYYPEIVNNRGSLFSEWILWCINKTFTGTEYSSLIPVNVAQMSTFFDRNISPITAKQNVLRSAFIYQASDLMFPETTNASTGLMQDGRINEDVALSLKEMLEMLKNVFDMDWYIDTNGKFRIEHISFFINGLSYSQNNAVSLDLRDEKYLKHLYDYKYSYKLDSDNLVGKEELRFNNNEAIGKSKNAVEPDGQSGATQQTLYGYYFTRVDDFEYGNIKYLADCVSTDEKGEPKKTPKSDSILITNFEGVRMADETVDVTKWVLLDVEEEPQIGEIGVLPEFQNYLVKSNVCERTTLNMSNGRLTATAIMRDFHRYNKPFSSGLMNYNDTPNGLIGKGFIRDMYSVLKTKRLKRITVPFCCTDSAFNPYLPLILPNGQKASVLKAEFDFSDETLSLDPLQNSACGYEVQFPTDAGGEYPPKGTVLTVGEAVDYCMVYSWIDSGYGCLGFNKAVFGVRTVYADGNGGSYYEDVIDYENQCQNDPLC